MKAPVPATIEASRRRSAETVASNTVAILQKIATQARTSAEIARDLGMRQATVRAYIRGLHARGEVHIVWWVARLNGGRPLSCWLAGRGKDVPKPTNPKDFEFMEELEPETVRLMAPFKPFRQDIDVALFGPYRPAVQGEAR